MKTNSIGVCTIILSSSVELRARHIYVALEEIEKKFQKRIPDISHQKSHFPGSSSNASHLFRQPTVDRDRSQSPAFVNFFLWS